MNMSSKKCLESKKGCDDTMYKGIDMGKLSDPFPGLRVED